MEENEKERAKLIYHEKLLNESIDHEKNPIHELVIELDWDEEDLNSVYEIFQEYNNKLENGEDVDWLKFELKLEDRLSIGYQTVKSIILAFYKNHEWTKVCKGYAKQHDVMEFKKINYGKKG